MEISGGGIDALADDNVAGILVCLDAVSVLRCRAVCKRWRRIATDRSFLAAHAAGRPRQMIIKTQYGYARSAVPLSPTDDDDGLDTTTTLTAAAGGDDRYLFDPRRTPPDGEGVSSEFILYASLDGLLLLAHRRHGPSSVSAGPCTYVICNPVTRQWANLPSPFFTAAAPPVHRRLEFRTSVACGFYLHASSGEYRLLLHCARGASARDLERYCCVATAGSALPRRLAHAPSTDEMIPYYDHPVCHRGTLHWLSGHPEGSSTGKMLAFDTASEAFRLMPRPPEPTTMETDKVVSHLLELDGELSVATIYWSVNGTMLDIWVLQDYEAEEWTLRHRLKVQRPPRCAGGWKQPIIMDMGNNAPPGSGNRSSAILVGFPQTREVMVYSLKDNEVRRKIDFGSFVSFKVFSESLVPHAFFDSPDTVPLNISNPSVQ